MDVDDPNHKISFSNSKATIRELRFDKMELDKTMSTSWITLEFGVLYKIL